MTDTRTDVATDETDRTVDALLRRISWRCFVAGRGGPASVALVRELRHAGERLAAAGGLDALDEAIVRLTEMNAAFSDERSNLLEAVWRSVGRAEA